MPPPPLPLLPLPPVTATAASAAGLPDCSRWFAGSRSTCPRSCRLWGSPSGAINLVLTSCAACSDGFDFPLTCLHCKPGNVFLTYDSYRQASIAAAGGGRSTSCTALHCPGRCPHAHRRRGAHPLTTSPTRHPTHPLVQECLPAASLGCDTLRVNATLQTAALSRGPCTSCAPRTAKIWAVARSDDYLGTPAIWQTGTGSGVAAASASASASQQQHQQRQQQRTAPHILALGYMEPAPPEAEVRSAAYFATINDTTSYASGEHTTSLRAITGPPSLQRLALPQVDAPTAACAPLPPPRAHPPRSPHPCRRRPCCCSAHVDCIQRLPVLPCHGLPGALQQ